MGYDVTFHLIDVEAVRDGLIPALLRGDPPPPSAFDQLDDAAEAWTASRTAVLEGEPQAAARAACELIVCWSAESLAYVWMRNFGITYHPLRMEEVLQSVPTTGFGSPRPLLEALLERRPELEPALPTRVEGSSTTGGFAIAPNGSAIRQWYEELPPNMRRRAAPLLCIFRAAQRRGFGLYEATDLARELERHTHDLAWPGLGRFGLIGGEPSPEEWDAILAVRDEWTEPDIHDLLDRAALVRDEALLSRILGAFGWSVEDVERRRELLDISLGDRAAIERLAESEYLFVPMSGVCRNEGWVERELGGQTLRGLTLRTEGGQPIWMVVQEDATLRTLPFRALIDEPSARLLLEELRPEGGQLAREPWNRRYERLRSMVAQGSPYELVEALSHLLWQRSQKELSFGERSLLSSARAALASELSRALQLPADEVERRLDPESPSPC
jgi:CarD family transcriptional regulator